MMCKGVSKSGSPISRCTTLRPCASRARARASTSNADSVPSRPILAASRFSSPTGVTSYGVAARRSSTPFGYARVRMPNRELRIAPLKEADIEAALPLFAGYQRFYEAEPDDERNRGFFARFVAPSDDGVVLGAWVGDELIGFACTYWTFSSTHAAEVAVMNDLFVAEG